MGPAHRLASNDAYPTLIDPALLPPPLAASWCLLSIHFLYIKPQAPGSSRQGLSEKFLKIRLKKPLFFAAEGLKKPLSDKGRHVGRKNRNAECAGQQMPEIRSEIG